MTNSALRIVKLAFPLVAAGIILGAAFLVIGTATAPSLTACVMPNGCDFLTGGGWIVYHGAKGTFGVGGGCKHGSGAIPGVPYWGHLEYIDHGAKLNVHATSITAYIFQDIGVDFDKNGHPVGERIICGVARTNQLGDVNFAVRAVDRGEPGVNDNFDIRLTSTDGTNTPLYDTTNECRWHYLGSYAPCSAGNGGGGNIQLHKPNPSTTGAFGGSCPAMFTGSL